MADQIIIAELRTEIAELKQMVRLLIDRVNPEQVYLTTEEVCAKYKVSASTLFAWKRSGILSPVQMGRVLRWSEEDIKSKFSPKK